MCGLSNEIKVFCLLLTTSCSYPIKDHNNQERAADGEENHAYYIDRLSYIYMMSYFASLQYESRVSVGTTTLSLGMIIIISS